MLKPEDIDNKTFEKSVSGYKKDEVDSFLNEVAETLKTLYDELEKTKKEFEEFKVKSKEREETVYSTLETAKGLIADISASAEKRADIILRNAQLDADALTKQTAANVASLKEQEQMLRKRVAALKLSLKSSIEAELLSIEGIGGELLDDNHSDSTNN